MSTDTPVSPVPPNDALFIPVPPAVPSGTPWLVADANLAAATVETGLQKAVSDAGITAGDLKTLLAHYKAGGRISLLSEAPRLLRDAKSLEADAEPVISAIEKNLHNRVALYLIAGAVLMDVSKFALPATAPSWLSAVWPVVGTIAAGLSTFLGRSAVVNAPTTKIP